MLEGGKGAFAQRQMAAGDAQAAQPNAADGLDDAGDFAADGRYGFRLLDILAQAQLIAAGEPGEIGVAEGNQHAQPGERRRALPDAPVDAGAGQ